MRLEREAWTKSMLSNASYMAGGGATAYEIARKLNVSTRSVFRYARKYDFELQVGADRKRPNTFEIELSDEDAQSLRSLAISKGQTPDKFIKKIMEVLISEGQTLIDNVLDE